MRSAWSYSLALFGADLSPEGQRKKKTGQLPAPLNPSIALGEGKIMLRLYCEVAAASKISAK